MKKNLRYLAGAAVGAVVALGFSSCAYDPYYSGGGSYSSGGYGGGYGDGYGYGGSSFSTSFFVSTGDPRWGYDPNCYSYYDYRRHCYYDPYLNGYYPVGYRPPVVYGVPHPYGWRPGGGYIRPPGHVTNVTVVNYRNREERYRNSSYGWAKQVRPGPGGGGGGGYGGRGQDQRPPQGGYGRTNYQNSDARTKNGTLPYNQRGNSYTKPGFQHGTTRQDPRYNSPVYAQDPRGKQTQQYGRQGQQYGKQAQQYSSRQAQPAQRAAQQQYDSRQPQQHGSNKKGKYQNDDDNRVRGYR